ncbi:hypothetical protein TNCV_3460051 [Trichonephila clavipes]|nr:hypothetical protein TNCV_3460051 [Trichonephila clavipes]
MGRKQQKNIIYNFPKRKRDGLKHTSREIFADSVCVEKWVRVWLSLVCRGADVMFAEAQSPHVGVCISLEDEVPMSSSLLARGLCYEVLSQQH